MRLLLISILLLIVQNLFAQSPSIMLQKAFGGSFPDDGWAIEERVGGGLIIAGNTESNDGDIAGNHGGLCGLSPCNDIWIAVLDSAADLEWQHCYGGTSQDIFGDLLILNDGSIVFCGSTTSIDGDVSSNHGLTDSWVVKLDSIGNIMWQKCYGGTNSEGLISIEQTQDEGFILTGSTTSNDGDVSGCHSCTSGNPDIWIIKVDSLGNLEWQKCLGGTGEDAGTYICELNNGSYMAACWPNSTDGDILFTHGLSDFWIAFLDSNGQLISSHSYGGSNIEFLHAASTTFDGGAILAGYTGSSDGDVTGYHSAGDFWIVKLDSFGNMEWQKCLGGSGNDEPFEIRQTKDSGYVVSGFTSSNDGDVTGNNSPGLPDFWIIKLSSNGQLVWQKPVGGSDVDVGQAVAEMQDSGFAIIGYTFSTDGDALGSGYHSSGDVWVVRLNGNALEIIHPVNSVIDFNVYIDTFADELFLSYNSNSSEQIEVKLFDITGRLQAIKLFEVFVGANKQRIGINKLETGIYFVQAYTRLGKVCKKIIFQ